MLDLDTLAEKCAKSSNEEEKRWRTVIWSTDFQKVSQHMSDGEVEIMVLACRSVGNFETLIVFLTGHPEFGALSPFEIMGREAGKAGASLRDWIQSLAKGG